MIGAGIGANIVSWLLRVISGPHGGSAKPFANHATLSQGLVSYWKLDEQSGVRYDSVVASANDLTDNNTVTYVNAGPSGVVADFVAANSEYLNTANTLAAADSDFTVAAWVNPATDALMSVCNDATGDFLFRRSAGGDMELFTRGFADTVASSGIPLATLNRWYFVVAWHDSVANQIGFSVNTGTPFTAATGGTNGDLNTFLVGARSAALAFWNGPLGRVGAWTRVLSSADIAALYNTGAGKLYSDLTAAEKVGLVSYWNLDEASGNRADSHGSNTLTDNNTVTSVVNAGGAMRNLAAQFTAANSETLTNSASTFNPGHTDFSFAGWVYFPDDGADDWFAASGLINNNLSDKVFVLFRNSGGLGITGNKLGASMGNGTTYKYFGTAAGYAIGWHNVVFSHDATANVMYLYVDDGAAASLATGADYPVSGDDIMLGGSIGFFSDVRLDESGLWSRVLTAQERTDLWNSGAGLFY